MPTGQITLNGITDADLIMILQHKEKNPHLGFSPQALQVTQVGAPPNNRPGYNNCVLTWQNENVLRVVYAILDKLIHGHASEPPTQ